MHEESLSPMKLWRGTQDQKCTEARVMRVGWEKGQGLGER
jgi:hypothetical protein